MQGPKAGSKKVAGSNVLNLVECRWETGPVLIHGSFGMIARAIESLFYTAAVTGTHRACREMGLIPDDADGSPAEQVRLAIAGPAETPAIEDEPATNGRKRTK